MITSSTVTIDAPAALVWQVFTDVQRWPEWTASVNRLVGLDGPDLAVGRRFQIDQPRMPRLRWTVTELVADTSWTWVQTSPGGRTTARHDVVANPDGTTEVRQVLDQGGVIGGLVGRMMRSMTQRYLEMEGQGLKRRSEELAKYRGPAT
ncbi:SRPBCC family protein [Mycobacterium sp. M26]|uniref:SRPBCC family protein n=1 Tax=Mycobacterium sp. M26 TaxID=1762962 RepID=UPI00073E27D8|nr:SRPBCC family protein [Mycobacterium sp. M26]